jgi:hypothetical protein
VAVLSQIGVAVAGAEQLIHVAVAALDVTVDDADRLAAQDGPAAVAGLTGGRGYRNFLRHDAQRRAAVLTATRYEDNGRFAIRRVVRGARTAHSTHHQEIDPVTTRGLVLQPVRPEIMEVVVQRS